VKDALHLNECEVIPGYHNRLFNFIMRMKLSIFQDSFQHPEAPKVARAQVWRIVGAAIVQCDACRILTQLLTYYDILNYPCAPKNRKRHSTTKIPVFRFQIRKHVLDEILLIKFASFR
jgi:hypothetical protein